MGIPSNIHEEKLRRKEGKKNMAKLRKRKRQEETMAGRK
jgi:hypothetical protein